ncbi:MAG: glycoside hydrolase family 43 protein [Treponema sp.]|nr:glycoside hydrolase family 43 protein [Treponema sp.]
MKKILSIISALFFAGMLVSCGQNTGSGDAELDGIVLDASSAKTSFYPGDTFTASGLIVKTKYTDGTTKKVSVKNCSFEIAGGNSGASGEFTVPNETGGCTVTVKYHSYTKTYDITVIPTSEVYGPEFLDNYVSLSSWNNRYKWNLANTHDPTVFKWTDGYYYMFGTDASYGNAHDGATKGKHFFGKRSVDLVNWEYVNGIMDEAPDWVVTKLNEIRDGMELDPIAKEDISFGYWAPCARKITVDGVTKVRMYYSIVIDNYIKTGAKTSTDFDGSWSERAFIGVAESTNPAGGPSAWEDKGFVVCSSSDKGLDYSRSKSNSYGDVYFYFNAIDPSYFIDEDGTHWLVYGSWHSGFALVRINPSTGKVAAVDGSDYLTGNVTGDFAMGEPWASNAEGLKENGYGTRIFSRGTSRWQPSEGPELVKYDGKYWLFFANDGLDIPYQTRVVCADSVQGPYYSINGSEMTNDVDAHSNESTNIYPVITHPYQFLDEEPASGGYGSCYGWVGISHCAIFDNGDGNWFYMSQQRLPENVDGITSSNALMMGGVRRIIWSPTGSSVNDEWPMVSPERYGGLPESYNPDENASDGTVSADEIPGVWQHITLSYDKGNMDTAVAVTFEADSEGGRSGTIKDAADASWGTWSFDESAQTLTITQTGKLAVTVSLLREFDWEKVPRIPTIVYTGANNDSTNGYTYWGKKGEPSSSYPYKFLEATCTQDLGDSPDFYLIQQMGTIVVTDSKGTDTSKEYSSSATAWWSSTKPTSHLTLSDGETITWTVKVTSDIFGLVLEGNTGSTYLDLNLNYNSSADAWGGGTWSVTSSDNEAYGINGHTYTIKVSRSGNVYTITVTDLGSV